MPADRLIHPRLGHSVKVCGLSDLEHRVWLTYELAADDYGVMRFSAVTIKSANEAFAGRSDVLIQKALDKLAEVGLVKVFTQQGRRYCYQEDWQNFQRIKHPRDTMQPLPDGEAIAACTSATRKLFAQHPSLRPSDDLGQISEELPQDVGNISDAPQTEKSELGSLACAHTRETANGNRLMANGSEGMQGDFKMDVAARELVNLYSPQGRCGWNLVERPLFAVLTADPAVPPAVAWEALKARLAGQQRSYQWRVKGMIPRMDRWLESGAHLQILPETPPSLMVTDKTAGTMSAAAIVRARAAR